MIRRQRQEFDLKYNYRYSVRYCPVKLIDDLIGTIDHL